MQYQGRELGKLCKHPDHCVSGAYCGGVCCHNSCTNGLCKVDCESATCSTLRINTVAGLPTHYCNNLGVPFQRKVLNSPCSADYECEERFTCSVGVCKKVVGDMCSSGLECATGSCTSLTCTGVAGDRCLGKQDSATRSQLCVYVHALFVERSFLLVVFF